MRRVALPAVMTARVSPTGDISVMFCEPSNALVSSTRSPRERCAFAFSTRSTGVRCDAAMTPSSPRSSMPLSTDICTPSSTDMTTTSASVPRTTPKSVNAERRGCPFTSSSDVRIDSPICISSLHPQRIDRIQARRANRGIHAEHESRAGREDHRGDDGARRDGGGILREHRNALREELADEQSEEAAEDRDEQRLGQHLEEDLDRRGADRLARADLAHALVE